MKYLFGAFVLACVIVGMTFGFWSKHAWSQDCPEGSFGCGHAEHHDQYKNWKRESTGMSCCNEGDCRPTRAYQDEDGHWHAWTGRTFVVVPDSALLKPDILKDGRSHVCSPKYDGTVIYCFSPTGQKS